ncbi:MAG: phosphoenolpyruvate synthase [Desulfovibrio sp.]|nr:phosphoenolpyruvate synthase [Desulfovibrio sp.]
MGIVGRIFSLFKGRDPEEEARSRAREEALRQKIVQRCTMFRRLLSINKTALELMSDLEVHLQGKRPFASDYVRAQGQKTCMAVGQMVDSLVALSGGAYAELVPAFQRIRDTINGLFSNGEEPSVRPNAPLILPLAEIRLDHAQVVGGKMANLGEIRANVGLAVPAGFAITVTAYEHFMRSNGLFELVHTKMQACDMTSLDEAMRLSQELQAAILQAPLPADLETAILAATEALVAQSGQGVLLALRSSAVGEDESNTTFAGQYRSELNVPPEEACHVWKEIIASKYSLSALSYRLQKGIADEAAPMSVGVLVMVDARCGGVAYSRNPVARSLSEDCVVINAVKGLPQGVVDGATIPCVYFLRHANPPQLLQKTMGADVLDDILDDGQIINLATVALALESFYTQPQDVEWAIDQKGELVILQSRPLQLLSELATDEACESDQNLPDDATILASGGIPASPGVGMGPPCILRREADMFAFPGGGIMVVERAFPRWAALLPRASGLISETGGAAGHLASVAREYGIPALFSLKGACKDLAGHSQITLDATHGRVIEGRHEELVPKVSAALDSVKASSAYQELVKLAEHVTPLHLLDPQSQAFRPENCTTLHDITRFCHEKAVSVLFDMQDTQGARIGKQLKCGAKLQYWVVDMGRAFTRPVEGSVVDITEIASLPMLALWDGMVAIRWDGPPSAGAAGFMSVVLESTMNPELESTAPTTMTERNFFILDADYMILQARYGYHFCTVECRACEHRSENLVTFQFKGGAADRERRMLRVRMLASLLEEFQFRVDVREDALFAVAEGFSHENTLRRTCLLGYLLIHSRQSDTIMLDTARASVFRAKLAGDMQSVFHRDLPFLPKH